MGQWTGGYLPTVVDYPAFNGLTAIYGNSCNSICNTFTRRAIRALPISQSSVRFLFGIFDGCYRPCSSPSVVSRGVERSASASSSLTYNLAVADSASAMAYTTFATISDSVWSTGTYDYAFTQPHHRAHFLVRVLQGGVAIDSARTYWPVDLESGTTAVSIDQMDDVRLAVWPNPSHGSVFVGFSLRNEAPATIELVDVAGRTVVARDLRGLGPGRHEVALFPAEKSLPGVYFVRFKRGGSRVVQRVAWLR